MWFQRLACLVTLFVIPACATTPASVPGYAEPHHHVRFQNGYVRVMETRLAPGEETLAHSHPIDAAVVFLSGGRIRVRNDDGTTRESSHEPGTVAFGTAPIVHHAANVGEETVRVISVEIFSHPPSRVATPVLSSLGEVLLENDEVRMARIRLSPGETVRISDESPSVLVALNKGTVVSGGSRQSLDAGGTLWCEADASEIRNKGKRMFESIVVTVKPRARTEPRR